MSIKVKIYHSDWEDELLLDANNKRVTRININYEWGTFIIFKNILTINWDKWGKEIFISDDNNKVFYKATETLYYFEDFEDLCYVDYENKRLVRLSDYKRARIYDNNKNNAAAFMSEEVPFDALRFFAISHSRIEVAA